MPSETDDNEFDLFWSIYPHSGRHAKLVARRAFAKARTRVSLEIMVEKLAEYIGHLSVHDWLRPCYAATWLNQERWDDEYDQPPTKPTESPEVSQWRLRVKFYKQDKFWCAIWGEPPDDRRCQAPIEILHEFGYRTAEPCTDNVRILTSRRR